MDYLQKLRNEGFRITKARKGILELFLEKKCALSALDISRYLKQKRISADRSTVYRELEFLENQNIISALVFSDGVSRYELSEQNHHHHLICNNCNDIKAVEVNHRLSQIEQYINQNHDFTVEKHSLEFYGKCHDCT